MIDQHTENLECQCEPKRITIRGHVIDLHRPITETGTTARRKIFGLPQGWVIVGNKSSLILNADQIAKERESYDYAERAKRKRARERIEAFMKGAS